MTNKYSEGYPGARYYGGNEYVLLKHVNGNFRKFIGMMIGDTSMQVH